MPVITSRSNERVIRACSLKDKKNRDREGLFIFEGEKLFSEAVSSGVVIDGIFVLDGVREKLAEALAPYDRAGKLFYVTEAVYEKLTLESSPQGIFCVAAKPERTEAGRGGFMIMLDRVADPGNLGTIIRSADAFGAELIISADSADIYNPKTVRACMGSLFRVKPETASLAGRIESLKAGGYSVLAAVLGDGCVPLTRVSLGGKVCIVIGNEGTGISEDIIGRCDGKVIIPMKDGPQSLNAAVAASVIMWEAYRKGGV